MKKILLVAIAVICSAVNVLLAQTPQYYINAGTGGNSIPFGGLSWVDQRCQFLYTPGEFGTVPAGMITAIYFRSSGSTPSTYTNLRIDIGQTALTSLPGTSWVTGLTIAMTAASYSVNPTAGGWVAYPLQTPVYFDPSMSLVVDTRQTNTSGGYPIYTSSASGYRRQYAASASGTPTGYSATRYDFGFDLITCQPVSNMNASNITVNSADLGWTGVSGSLGYEIVVDQNASSPTGAGTFSATTSYHASGLAINSAYYFHVRNICSNGYSPWVTSSFTTLNAYCLPPASILFSNVTTASVDLLWSLMPTTDWYEYRVDQVLADPVYGTPVNTTTAIATQITGLNPGEKYYMHIRSFCLNGNDSSIWKVDSFITKSYCGAPELQVAGKGTNNVSVLWNKVTDAVAYEYVVNNVPGDPAYGQETYDTMINNIALPADGKDKYIHVRTKCNSQFSFSAWSNEALRQSADGIAAVPEQGSGVSVFPNPVKENLAVNIAGGGNCTYILTDLTGRLIKKGAVRQGETISLAGMPGGTYLMKCTVDLQTVVIKVLKE